MTKRILVVDDDYFIQVLIEAVLLDLGMQVFLADSIASAEAAVAAHQPEIILVDLELKERDSGLAVTRRLRASGYRGYIVAMSANLGSEVIRAFADAGSDAFLPKPIDLVQLRDVCLSAPDNPN